VICLKTLQLRVPPYKFHHVEIPKNILTPNTSLKFVPHLRDLEPSQVRTYQLWLSELERMDSVSGFKTPLDADQKLAKIVKHECISTLSLFIDHWLDELAITGLNKATLIQFMTSEAPDDDITPHQKSTILNSYGDDKVIRSPQAFKVSKMFTDAFNQVFKNWADQPISLREILMRDKSVENVVDSKKTANHIPAPASKPQDPIEEVTAYFGTYDFLGCLICFSHSCEHGDFNERQEKRTFGTDCMGGLTRVLRERHMLSASKQHSNGLRTESLPAPCSPDCYRFKGTGPPDTRTRDWTYDEIMVLKSLAVSLDSSRVKILPQCWAAQLLGRKCWDVNRESIRMKLGSIYPVVDFKPILSPVPPKVKPVPWYDRRERCLVGDWQDFTVTHEYSRREANDPCNHEGPCTIANGCHCAELKVLCDRFCHCTAETCAIKYTGCACHANGKTCFSKQKERPCICVQLNRECDPALCGSCGALARADPANADDDALHATGCQNCALQRGQRKRLCLGESQLEGVGYGLFTAEDIAKDDFVIEYVGELISHDEGVRREARRGEDVFDQGSNSSYLFTLLENEGLWVDAAIYGNLSRYINHASETDKKGCNITPKILMVNGEFRIKFTALRDIKAGEELFFNYGENFPNLTKKLLDDKEQQEGGTDIDTADIPVTATTTGRGRGARRRRGDGERGEVGKVSKRGKPKGVRKGAPGMSRVSATVQQWTSASFALADPDVDAQPKKTRKRKRVVEDEDDEEEYQPDVVETTSVADSVEDHATGFKRGSGRWKRVSRLADSDDDSIRYEETTPSRRGRGSRGRGRGRGGRLRGTPGRRRKVMSDKYVKEERDEGELGELEQRTEDVTSQSTSQPSYWARAGQPELSPKGRQSVSELQESSSHSSALSQMKYPGAGRKPPRNAVVSDSEEPSEPSLSLTDLLPLETPGFRGRKSRARPSLEDEIYDDDYIESGVMDLDEDDGDEDEPTPTRRTSSRKPKPMKFHDDEQ
jgi:hypothetical protein